MWFLGTQMILLCFTIHILTFQYANKNSLEAVKKSYSNIRSRNNWHYANLPATTENDIRLQPSIDYAKHKHLNNVKMATIMCGTIKVKLDGNNKD